MIRLRTSVFCLLLSTASISGCMPQDAKAPEAASAGVANALLAAMHAEAKDAENPDPYLDAIDLAAKNPRDPEALAVTIAALDALTDRSGSVPYRIAVPIVDRNREGFQKTVLRLRTAWETLEGAEGEFAPLMRARIAGSLHELAMLTGEERGARVWWARRACVPIATVIGPLDAAPLTALEEKGAADPKGPLAANYASDSRFAAATTVSVSSDACQIDARRANHKLGLRELVVDIDNPSDQRISFALASSSAAVLELGGVRVLERRFESGGAQTTVFGSALVPEGKVRAVIRLADKGDASPIELTVVDAAGNPLRTRAPGVGDSAGVVPKQPVQINFARRTDSDATLVSAASALLALGEARRAEQALERALIDRREGRDPAVYLLWIRAMALAGDMPDQKRVEREKAALAELDKSLPNSWEVRLSKAELAQQKKGYGEGTFAALELLGVGFPGADLGKANVLELAYIINLAQQAMMDDVTERAFAALETRARGAQITADNDARVHRRNGQDALRVSCDGGLSRSTTACAQAKEAVGDRAGALAEIERLRGLRSAPDGLLGMELNLRIAQGDDKGALAAYDSMLPGERSLMTILPVLARSADRKAAHERIEREALWVGDGPYALARSYAFFGEPSADVKKHEDIGRAIVERDRTAPTMPGAATAVLRHIEHYGIDESGLIRVFLYDLRRVSGTADVERGIFVEQPMMEARGITQQLRRRVHKKDGRILEPDRASFAAQGGSDLSQLEQGDYIEHVFEGFYVPTETGELTIDTPDLLPERTSVAEAELVIRMPASIKASTWIHPMLGKPEETTRGGYKFWKFSLKNQAPRRIEDGLSYLERGVRVSLSTQSWAKVGRAIGENIRSLEETDPFMARFAREAVKSATGEDKTLAPNELVARVVEHVGKVIKVASGGGELSDFAGYYGGGAQSQTARGAVEEGVGSRTWVIYRTLRELGVDAEVAVAETEPFSASPNFPPHPGRFKKPLVVAKLASGSVWIDADVQGPPLPPGRLSPELRGRSAILGNGDIVAVPVAVDDAVDEVSIDLTLEPSGTAKGKVSLTLRGAQAQMLAEAFFYVVGDDRTQMLRSVVQSFLPWASVDEVKLASSEGAWEIKLDAQVTIPGFGSIDGKDGKTLMLPGIEPAKRGTLAQRYASRLERQSALTIDSPIQYRVKRRVTLPAGISVERPAPSLEKKGSILNAKRSFKLEGNTIVEEFSLSLPTGTVGSEAYRAFLDDVQAIDAGFLAGTRVKKAP